jgi:hypothetical protein
VKIAANPSEAIWVYLDRLVTTQAGLGDEVVEGEFNGTPVRATLGMTKEKVYLEWWRARNKAQEHALALAIDDVRRRFVGKRMTEVRSRQVDSGTPDVAKEVELVFADGSSLVVELR